MRHAIRIQPYLARDLFQKLRAYAAARSLTVSAVINAALAEYLERDEVDDALVVRRLNDVSHGLGKLTRDLEALFSAGL
jgi:predicted transcriptional regulator